MSTLFVNFWKKYGGAVLVIVAVSLIFIVAFRAGQLNKEGAGAAKINITIAENKEIDSANQKAKVIGEALERKDIESNAKALTISGSDNQATEEKECAFVGSKNSTKYHLPNCKNAIRIKDSNKVCFSSEEDAIAKGYERAKCCFE